MEEGVKSDCTVNSTLNDNTQKSNGSKLFIELRETTPSGMATCRFKYNA